MVSAEEHPLEEIDETKKHLTICTECGDSVEGFRCSGTNYHYACPKCGRWTNELYMKIDTEIKCVGGTDRFSQLQHFGYCPWCDVVFTNEDNIIESKNKQKWFKDE